MLIGAKLLYIVTIIPAIIENWDVIKADMGILYQSLSAGFVFYGGLIGGLIGYYIYCRQFKLDFLLFMDLMAPSLPIMHGIGRIGCLFAGCCYGIHYEGPFHITFERSIVAPNGVPLFPTQIVESILNIIAGIFLIIYSRRERQQGRIIAVYIIYYSIIRFILEFLRGDIPRGMVFSISTSQLISILLLPIGLYLFLKPKKAS